MLAERNQKHFRPNVSVSRWGSFVKFAVFAVVRGVYVSVKTSCCFRPQK